METTEPKYYTPEIEEFHVGFEFECHIDNGLISKRLYEAGQEWKHTVVQRGDFFTIIDPKTIRVKHLDREDIESLGFFKSFHNQWAGWFDYNKMVGDSGGRDYYLYLTIHQPRCVNDMNRVEDNLWKIVLHRYYKSEQDKTTNIDEQIRQSESKIVFEGKLKNKSELKRLMAQLGII